MKLIKITRNLVYIITHVCLCFSGVYLLYFLLNNFFNISSILDETPFMDVSSLRLWQIFLGLVIVLLIIEILSVIICFFSLSNSLEIKQIKKSPEKSAPQKDIVIKSTSRKVIDSNFKEKSAFYSLQEMERILGYDSRVIKLYEHQSNEVNAFTIGWPTPAGEKHRIYLNSGLNEAMDVQSIIAVIGHEVGHIHNGDVHVKMVMSSTRNILSIIGLIPLYIIHFSLKCILFVTRIIPFLGLLVSTINMVLGFLITFTRIVENIFLWPANLFELYISRQSEYYADAVSSKLVGPSAMIGALNNLGHYSNQKQKKSSMVNFFQKLQIITSTHPSVEDRITAIRSRKFVKKLKI